MRGIGLFIYGGNITTQSHVVMYMVVENWIVERHEVDEIKKVMMGFSFW